VKANTEKIINLKQELNSNEIRKPSKRNKNVENAIVKKEKLIFFLHIQRIISIKIVVKIVEAKIHFQIYFL